MSFLNLRFSVSLWLVVLILIGASTRLAAVWGDSGALDLEVRAMLSANCYACHGPDESSREAHLRLDVRESAVAARKDRPAIVPGNRAESEVFRRITSGDPDVRMPPPDSGHNLTPEQISRIGDWIDGGALFPGHWSFAKPTRPALPQVKDRRWPRHPLDAFVLAKLEAVGLRPNPEADRYALIRRLSLDLTGIPPTLSDVDTFVNDRAENAYEKLVDRLLASDRFGEHWARMWLDLARYADTTGYEKDQPRNIWRYRDWVINALNADMSYDQFTMEQLAGDLLPDPTTDQLLATAFHRNTLTNSEGGTDNEEFRVAAVKDRVDTTVQVWMGLTMGCAKCHSHKYDPITHQEYYRFFDFFNQTEDADRPDDAPRIATPTADQRIRRLELTEQLARLKTASEQATEESSAQVAEVEERIAALDKQIVRTPILRELPAGGGRKTHVHVRGNFREHGDEVDAGFPVAFSPDSGQQPTNRLDVARWLVDADNPLTSRVAVNRFWARLFGVGLVETEEDFGTQGLLPSHPELLDWLAVEFRGSLGWSMKLLCKTIVMSATYRQSARVNADAVDTDPNNRLLGRAPRFRLPAETVRDQALAVSGLLSATIGGPSVMPPQPPGIWRTTYSKLRWETSAGEDRYRRALYTFWRRTSPYPAMTTFDAGSREVCVMRRVRTNTPLQALIVMNDPVYVEAAGALARSLVAEKHIDLSSRVARGFRAVLIRPPSEAETERLERLVAGARAYYQVDVAAAAELLKSANLTMEPGADPVELAAWTVVGNVLLNLDETLMRN